MIVLRGGETLIRVDPRHGAEVLDLVDLRTGRQLLGRPPFGSRPPRGGELSEEEWSLGWRGGWQSCFPSYGNACRLDGVRHGFHGRASADPWELVDREASRATLSWRGHGLKATKEISAAPAGSGCEVRVEVALEALEAESPAIALEHIALGLEVIEPELELELPDGEASELDAQLRPVRPPGEAPFWPEIGLDEGGERGDRWSLADERSRLFVVRDVADGFSRVVNPARGQTVEITWDRERLPHVVVWHEARVSGGIWRQATEVLCIEPCSVPHEAGLAPAAEDGLAWMVQPGEPLSWWTSVRSLP